MPTYTQQDRDSFARTLRYQRRNNPLSFWANDPIRWRVRNVICVRRTCAVERIPYSVEALRQLDQAKIATSQS